MPDIYRKGEGLVHLGFISELAELKAVIEAAYCFFGSYIQVVVQQKNKNVGTWAALGWSCIDRFPVSSSDVSL